MSLNYHEVVFFSHTYFTDHSFMRYAVYYISVKEPHCGVSTTTVIKLKMSNDYTIKIKPAKFSVILQHG